MLHGSVFTYLVFHYCHGNLSGKIEMVPIILHGNTLPFFYLKKKKVFLWFHPPPPASLTVHSLGFCQLKNIPSLLYSPPELLWFSTIMLDAMAVSHSLSASAAFGQADQSLFVEMPSFHSAYSNPPRYTQLIAPSCWPLHVHCCWASSLSLFYFYACPHSSSGYT